jgi:hypothetical protein
LAPVTAAARVLRVAAFKCPSTRTSPFRFPWSYVRCQAPEGRKPYSRTELLGCNGQRTDGRRP